MIEQQLASVAVETPPSITNVTFDLVELEFVEGGKARPARVLPPHESPRSVQLSAPALLLRAKQQRTAAESSSNQAVTPNRAPVQRSWLSSPPDSGAPSPSPHQSGDADPLRFLPSASLTGSALPPLLHSGSFRSASSFTMDDTLPVSSGSPSAFDVHNMKTVRERLALLYGVPQVDFLRMLRIDRVLRRAQQKARVELLVAFAEKGLQSRGSNGNSSVSELPRLVSPTQSVVRPRFVLDDEDTVVTSAACSPSPIAAQQSAHASPKDNDTTPQRHSNAFAAVMGSPSQLVRRMKSQGMVPNKSDSNSSIHCMSIGSANVLLKLLHDNCMSTLRLLFDAQHALTRRHCAPLPADFRAFVFESGAFARSSVAALASHVFDLKWMRRDFERFEQQERFKGERVQHLRSETAYRGVVQQLFYALWCVIQQGRLAVEEQVARDRRVISEEKMERDRLVCLGFESFERAVRYGYLCAAELRHRVQYTAYHAGCLEHGTRRAVVESYWIGHRLLELERDFSMASQVMLRIYHRALKGYDELEVLKLLSLEAVYRRQLAAKEDRLRLVMLAMLEQLFRQWLEQTILAWLAPVVEKIASKAIADGKVLLALELKEMRNVRAREEARLRVLLRQNSQGSFSL